MRSLPIILLCSVVINLLLYDKIILMSFMHHSKLEYVEQMHIMSLPIILHQTDVSCSHCGWLSHSKSTLVVSVGYSSFISAMHIYTERQLLGFAIAKMMPQNVF